MVTGTGLGYGAGLESGLGSEPTGDVMPLVDLDDPDDLRARWCALAAVAHATGYDRRWWADETGWHHEDPAGNDLRFVSPGQDRSVLFGFHSEISRTAEVGRQGGLLAGAPEWIAQPEVRHRMATGEIGFVYGHFAGTWARAPYPGDPWQPLDDGFTAVGDWLVSDEDSAAELVEWGAEWADYLGAIDQAMPAGLELVRAARGDGITSDHLLDLFDRLGIGPASPRHPDLAAALRAAARFGTAAPAERAAPVEPPPPVEAPPVVASPFMPVQPAGPPMPEYVERPLYKVFADEVEPEVEPETADEDWDDVPALARLGLIDYDADEDEEGEGELFDPAGVEEAPAAAWEPSEPVVELEATQEFNPFGDEPAAPVREPEPAADPEPPVGSPFAPATSAEPAVESAVEPESPVAVPGGSPFAPAASYEHAPEAEPERGPGPRELGGLGALVVPEPEPPAVPAGSLAEAMRLESERTRPDRESAARKRLHEWCRERTRIVPSGFTIHVQALDPDALLYSFDLDPPEVPGAELGPGDIGGLLRDLWQAEADDAQGGWMFARIDAAGRTLRIDRWYDQVPDWWTGDVDEAVDVPGLARRLASRAPQWRPSYVGRLVGV